MNDMVVPLLVHFGVKKVSILGWDGAKLEEDGSIEHFYDIEPKYTPNLNYVRRSYDLKNLKSDMKQCEQEIGQMGELAILKHLRDNGVEIEILTKNSLITKKINRNYILYNS